MGQSGHTAADVAAGGGAVREGGGEGGDGGEGESDGEGGDGHGGCFSPAEGEFSPAPSAGRDWEEERDGWFAGCVPLPHQAYYTADFALVLQISRITQCIISHISHF